jgi:hypothetical protein
VLSCSPVTLHHLAGTTSFLILALPQVMSSPSNPASWEWVLSWAVLSTIVGIIGIAALARLQRRSSTSLINVVGTPRLVRVLGTSSTLTLLINCTSCECPPACGVRRGTLECTRQNNPTQYEFCPLMHGIGSPSPLTSRVTAHAHPPWVLYTTTHKGQELLPVV